MPRTKSPEYKVIVTQCEETYSIEDLAKVLSPWVAKKLEQKEGGRSGKEYKLNRSD